MGAARKRHHAGAGFVGIADEVGTTTAAAAAAVTIGRQRGRAAFAEGEPPREGKPRTLDYLGLRTVLQKDRPPLYQDVNWQLAKLETPQSLDDIPRQAPVYQTAFATPGGILILDRPPQEKWKECRVCQLAVYVINIARIDQSIPIWYVHIVMHKDK